MDITTLSDETLLHYVRTSKHILASDELRLAETDDPAMRRRRVEITDSSRRQWREYEAELERRSKNYRDVGFTDWLPTRTLDQLRSIVLPFWENTVRVNPVRVVEATAKVRWVRARIEELEQAELPQFLNFPFLSDVTRCEALSARVSALEEQVRTLESELASNRPQTAPEASPALSDHAETVNSLINRCRATDGAGNYDFFLPATEHAFRPTERAALREFGLRHWIFSFRVPKERLPELERELRAHRVVQVFDRKEYPNTAFVVRSALNGTGGFSRIGNVAQLRGRSFMPDTLAEFKKLGLNYRHTVVTIPQYIWNWAENAD